MLRYLSLAALPALALALGTGGQARAQDDVKKLEAELQKLQEQVKDVEAKLKAAKEAAEKKDTRRPGPAFGRRGGPGPFGRMDPARRQEMREQFEKRMKEREGARTPRAFGRDFRRSPETTKSSDVEKRLERILKEVEELRQELKKK
jgi:DNA repair exonuclease SbcCD ATPase subunit